VTPEAATVALVLHLRQWLDENERIHEPACGDGAIARVLARHGFPVFATDLVDRGHGISGVDFLKTGPATPYVITNPPFALADQFIRKAVPGSRLVAFLLKSDFWHAASRIALHDAFPPAQELILTWRLDWTGQGRPTMNTTWWVWGDVPKGRWLLPHPGVFA
jgi:hypothetical protein